MDIQDLVRFEPTDIQVYRCPHNPNPGLNCICPLPIKEQLLSVSSGVSVTESANFDTTMQ
ncbi:hypothetical protein [Acaryochloris marina]|uniref:Uncharacterized protein n=1 Tax=Acaryochloris marina (strain MBIC 11017) TaxID=329726 RepID=B0CFS3_ACAM1|nr:hypothetical protein [Acaryochloris marina]ABW28227.1 hypothetical protein AM1_3231 [Acaryochloris marina MBIC11017]